MNKITTEKCREQFEDWMASLPGFELADVERRDNGEYSYSETQWCWKSWQASRQALDIALPILEQQERGDGWIEWGGGSVAPVDGVVEVRWSTGSTDIGHARDFRWEHSRYTINIIAYRIVPDQPTNQSGEQ